MSMSTEEERKDFKLDEKRFENFKPDEMLNNEAYMRAKQETEGLGEQLKKIFANVRVAVRRVDKFKELIEHETAARIIRASARDEQGDLEYNKAHNNKIFEQYYLWNRLYRRNNGDGVEILNRFDAECANMFIEKFRLLIEFDGMN